MLLVVKSSVRQKDQATDETLILQVMSKSGFKIIESKK
jgi:hypothetical protein